MLFVYLEDNIISDKVIWSATSNERFTVKSPMLPCWSSKLITIFLGSTCGSYLYPLKLKTFYGWFVKENCALMWKE